MKNAQLDAETIPQLTNNMQKAKMIPDDYSSE